LREPAGADFNVLGVIFDGALSMTSAIGGVVTDAGWKLRTLLRTRRYFTDAELILLFKAHLLSFLEYRTPAVYHATQKLLGRTRCQPSLNSDLLHWQCVETLRCLVLSIAQFSA
jgi:hypothetical protein